MPETRRVKLTKKLIRDAFLELLEDRPLNRITVKDICDLADVNRSTFYAHYETIEQLLMEIEEDILSRIPISPGISLADIDESFVQLLINFFRYVRDNRQLFRILTLRPDSGLFNHRLIDTVMDRFRKQTAFHDSQSAHYSYIYCMSGVIGIMSEWIRSDFPIECDELARMVLRLSLASVGSIDTDR